MSATLSVNDIKFTIFGSGYDSTRNDSGEGDISLTYILKIVDPVDGYIGDVKFKPPVSNVNPCSADISVSDCYHYADLKEVIIDGSHDTLIDYPKDVLYLVDVDWVTNAFVFWLGMKGDVVNKYIVIGDNVVTGTKLYIWDVNDSSYIKIASITQRGNSKLIDLEYYTRNDVLVYSMQAYSGRTANEVGSCWILPWLLCLNPKGTFALSAGSLAYNWYDSQRGPFKYTSANTVAGFLPTSVAKADAFWRNEAYIEPMYGNLFTYGILRPMQQFSIILPTSTGASVDTSKVTYTDDRCYFTMSPLSNSSLPSYDDLKAFVESITSVNGATSTNPAIGQLIPISRTDNSSNVIGIIPCYLSHNTHYKLAYWCKYDRSLGHWTMIGGRDDACNISYAYEDVSDDNTMQYTIMSDSSDHFRLTKYHPADSYWGWSGLRLTLSDYSWEQGE